MRPAGLILAGGAARRMSGGDKPLLTVGGTTILARLICRLATEAAPLAISANGDPARFAAFGLPVLEDEAAFAGQGPLAGLLAGLDWAARRGSDALLTVPGDTPFVPPGLVARLARPPAVAASGGRRHHLVALWPVAARTALREWLSRGEPHGVGRFAEALGVQEVAFASTPFDPFINVNAPEDLAQARDIARILPPGRDR